VTVDLLNQSVSVATIATALGSAFLAAAAGIVFAAKWVISLVHEEKTERITAVKEIWTAIDTHRQDETDHERELALRLAGLATKEDLKRQTELILAAVTISGRAAR
jgi:hypothetical protein